LLISYPYISLHYQLSLHLSTLLWLAIAILFLSNKEVGKDADHWLLTSSEGNGGFRCVAKLYS